jgi:hypothetical protein
MLFAATLSPAFSATADNADTANESNNPLNFASGMTLQDSYTPRLYDTSAHTNDLLVRGTLPIAPNDFIGVAQLLRATAPISTRPDPHGGYTTGEGDLNLFDIFLLKTDGVQLGVGPQITAKDQKIAACGSSYSRWVSVAARSGSQATTFSMPSSSRNGQWNTTVMASHSSHCRPD